MENFDILIVCHKKDSLKLPLVLESIEHNIVGFENIHIISNSTLNIDHSKVFTHNEKDILEVDFDKIHYRPTWIYQQLLKLLQTVTQDWFLVIDADTIVTKKIEPMANGNPKFFFNQNEQEYPPYFNFCKKLNVKKVCPNTFISEIMMFNRSYIKKLFESNNLDTEDKILNFIYKNVNIYHQLSEYELYGNFIEMNFPDLYEKKFISSWGFGKGSKDENFWNENRIKVMTDVYSKDYDLMSFHTYN